MIDNLLSTTRHPQQDTLITHLLKRTKAYLTAINTPLPSKLHQSTECCPLKMPATETCETLGRKTFRTWPKSPKNAWGILPLVWGTLLAICTKVRGQWDVHCHNEEKKVEVEWKKDGALCHNSDLAYQSLYKRNTGIHPQSCTHTFKIRKTKENSQMQILANSDDTNLLLCPSTVQHDCWSTCKVIHA